MSGILPFLYGQKLDWQIFAIGLGTLVISVHLVGYVLDPYNNRKYPGPFLARFSDAWLGWVSKQGHRSEVVHALHEKHGPFVRIAPNHVSIAEPEALNVIYGHGNGALKSNFYDAFVSIHRGLFNTRDRHDHTRKRKITSHIFSQKSVLEFEPQIRLYVAQLIAQWDRLHEMAVVRGVDSGVDGEGGWRSGNGRLWFDCLPWANYLAFDLIGDLAFGRPFGMIEAAKDSALVPKDQKAAMKSYGDKDSSVEVVSIPAVKILNGRGEFSMSMGVLPPWSRPYVRELPWYSKGKKDVKTLAGIAIMAVAKRLADPTTDRVDLLSKLQQGRDSEGRPMGKEELTAEALTFLIAGSDTTSNSTCAILYYLAGNRRAQAKLHQELDEHLGRAAGDDDDDEAAAAAAAATENQVKKLPYLDACINEALRIHSTSSIGLPRVVPEGGMMVLDRYFPPGAVLSVPSYSIHRDRSVWGEDVEAYRPERWFERDQGDVQKAFNPFSVGPRACVGRNFAVLELQIIIASIMRRYDIVLGKEDQKLETREGFLRKPLGCQIGIKRRDL